MIIGVLTVEAHLSDAHSLKDKRRVIKSLTDRIRAKFNVSIAQVGALDTWQSTELGLAMVSNDQALIHKVFTTIVDYIEAKGELVITDYRMQMF